MIKNETATSRGVGFIIKTACLFCPVCLRNNYGIIGNGFSNFDSCFTIEAEMYAAVYPRK